jgi:hypothetical protein
MPSIGLPASSCGVQKLSKVPFIGDHPIPGLVLQTTM